MKPEWIGRCRRNVLSHPLQIGHDSSSPERYFHGLIDEPSVYNTALTAEQIRAIYRAGSNGKRKPGQGLFALFRPALSKSPPALEATPTPLPQKGIAPPSGLVSWWRAEGDALDSSGSNHGVLHNGVGFTDGEVGQAFLFNGMNSYVEVPDSASLRLTKELTIEFWVKRLTLDPRTGEHLLDKGGDWTGGTKNYGVAIHLPSRNHCLHFLCAGAWWGGGSIADLDWHHCAVVARNGQAAPEIYIDGALQGITYHEGLDRINLYPSTGPLHIGAQVDPESGWCYYSKALVDELSIYNRALAAGEIQAIFAAGQNGKRKPGHKTRVEILERPS